MATALNWVQFTPPAAQLFAAVAHDTKLPAKAKKPAATLTALAWAARSRDLALIAVAYTGTALLANLYDVSGVLHRLGWNIPLRDQTLPNVPLPAPVLTLAGVGAFAVQRRQRLAG